MQALCIVVERTPCATLCTGAAAHQDCCTPLFRTKAQFCLESCKVSATSDTANDTARGALHIIKNWCQTTTCVWQAEPMFYIQSCGQWALQTACQCNMDTHVTSLASTTTTSHVNHVAPVVQRHLRARQLPQRLMAELAAAASPAGPPGMKPAGHQGAGRCAAVWVGAVSALAAAACLPEPAGGAAAGGDGKAQLSGGV
jgi:hypothetical protein